MMAILYITTFIWMKIETGNSEHSIARSWGDYFSYFWVQWGLDSPYWLNDIKLGYTSLSPAAAGIVILCTLIMMVGIKNSSTFNVIVTILNLASHTHYDFFYFIFFFDREFTTKKIRVEFELVDKISPRSPPQPSLCTCISSPRTRRAQRQLLQLLH